MQRTFPDYRLVQLWIERRGHLNHSAINAIATVPSRKCRIYRESTSSTKNVNVVQTNSHVRPTRQYCRMTQRCRHLLIHLRRALPSNHRLQERSASSICLATNFINECVTFDGRICDTSLVIDPPSETLRQRRRYVHSLRLVELSSVPGRSRFDHPAQINSSCCRPYYDDYRFSDCQGLSPSLRSHPINETHPTTDANHRIGDTKYAPWRASNAKPRINSARLAQPRVATRRTHCQVNRLQRQIGCKRSTNELISTLFKQLFI